MVMPCLNNANNINKILTHPQKMNNSHGHVPRNLKFNDHSIRNFVQSSSFLNSTSAIKQNLEDYNRQPTVPNVSNFTHKPNPKGFDFYNKRNLLLSQCNSEDIQVLNKNILLFAEDVVIFPQPATMKNIPTRQKSPVQAKPYTANNFYKPPANKIPNEQKSPKKSKQAEMNEFLFNYRKNQEQKKSKKLKFLQEMEKRLNNIQKQAAMITEKKQVQYEQINGILNLHSEATSFAKKAEVVGKLNATLYELKKQQNKPMSPRKITSEMGLIQINAAIEENHEYNDALLDEVERVSRSKSRERVNLKGKKQIEKEASFRKTGMKKGNNDDKPQNELSKTLKRPMQIPPRPVYSKKLTTTWRGK